MRQSQGTRVILHGYYGFRNTGDEVILDAVLRELRRVIPDPNPTVISADPAWTRRVHHVEAVNAYSLTDVALSLRDAAIVVLGGGGLFHDYWPRDNAELLSFPAKGVLPYAQICLLAKLYAKPLALLAQGVGPIRTEEGARLLQLICQLADKITLRDNGSLRLLQELHCAQKVSVVAPDPGFAFPIADRSAARKHVEELVSKRHTKPRSVIGVCIRQWPFVSDWSSMVAKGLDAFLDANDAVAVFVPMQNGPYGNDRIQSKSLIASMLRQDRCLLLNQVDHRGVATILAGCDAVVAMRLHAVILSLLAGVPVVALAYDEKVREVMLQVGQENLCTDLHAISPADLSERLRSLMSLGLPSPYLKKATSRLAARVRDHFDGLHLIEHGNEQLPKRFERSSMPRVVARECSSRLSARLLRHLRPS